MRLSDTDTPVNLTARPWLLLAMWAIKIKARDLRPNPAESCHGLARIFSETVEFARSAAIRTRATHGNVVAESLCNGDRLPLIGQHFAG